MLSFIEGTLLISNLLLIFFSVLYGFFIVKKHKEEESSIWVYFLIASGLFFLSELFTIYDELFGVEVGTLRAFLTFGFGILVLFAFLSKYESLESRKHH